MSWAFLTALFFLLSISAIGLSWSIFHESVVNTKKWMLITSIVAGSFAIFMFCTKYYMRIIDELYGNTVLGGNDIPAWLLNASNVLGFAATIFLVASVSAILFSVEEKEKEKEAATKGETKTESEPETEEQTIAKFQASRKSTTEVTQAEKGVATTASLTLADKYERQMLNLKFVLYVGGAMLFIAVLQLNTLSEWHRAFLPPEFSTAVTSLHTTYFKSGMTFQAGIYTIMLAVLYLPAAYIIKQKAEALNRVGVLPAGTLEQKGLSFKFWEFLPKLLTILSPFLAGHLLDFIK